jgi:hypothetical protein
MDNNYISRSVGKNLTEYTHKDYFNIINTFVRYVRYSQFDTSMRVGYYSDTPICGAGEILFGVDALGRTVKLKAIIDSSD